LETLGAPVTYTAQAPGLFEQYCSVCHQLNGKGGTIGPDLTAVGDRRSITFLESFISDPATVISGSTMPAFKNSLGEAQIDDIAAYLADQHAIRPPTSTTTPVVPTVTTTTPSTPPPPSAPPIPHSLAGRDNCLGCHQTGANGAPVVPADHAGRTNDICQSCHHTVPGLEEGE
jgi:mono/diheme cytochrome c family protein